MTEPILFVPPLITAIALFLEVVLNICSLIPNKAKVIDIFFE